MLNQSDSFGPPAGIAPAGARQTGFFHDLATPKNKKQYPKNDIEKPTGLK